MSCRLEASAVVLTMGLAAASADVAAAGIDVRVASRSLQPGELVVFTMKLEGEASRVRIKALGRAIPAFKVGNHTWRALLGLDIDQKPGTYLAVIEARSTSTLRATHELVIKPKQFPTRVLRVDPNFVNPPASVMPQIQQDNEFLRQVYGNSDPNRLWSSAFVRPVPGETNSRFGTRSVFNGEPRSPHSGADFLSGAGTPIKAPNSGRIVAARELYFSGNTVIIDHGLGVFSMLAHLSQLDVREGEMVSAGQIVGLVGATGRVTGPHLHWALRVSGARIDPMSALALLADTDASSAPRN
jgi:murein DD-endopeptidase MepM/ murein hydrolase activator NlpD